MTKIAKLFIYPVKSFAGIEVTSAELSQWGLSGDRRWMVVNEAGQMLTQRKDPRMVTVQPSWIDGVLHLQHRNAGQIPLSDSSENCRVSIWKDSVEARLACAEVQEWLNTALPSKNRLRLVHYLPDQQREPGQIERFGASARHFADAAPFLVATMDSLHKLNAHLVSLQQEPVDIRHFRPNIVLEGLPAFSEHHYKTLQFENGASLRLVDHCQRCVMITVNPDSGEKRPQASPLLELASLNSMPNQAKAPAFGVNCHLLSTALSSTIRCGESVTLV